MLRSLQRVMSFYAVARGHTVGVYDTWAKCEQQVKGFKGAKYKKFPTRIEAEVFISNPALSFGGNNIVGVPPKAPKRKHQSSPPHLADPLGHSKRKASGNDMNGRQQMLDDFWPTNESDNDNALVEAELLAVMAELEADGAADRNQSTTHAVKDIKQNRHDQPESYSRTKYHSKVWQEVGTKRIGGHDFAVDEQDYVIVYTDGSCINNGRKNASAGYGVYFGTDHLLNAAQPVTGRVTNNVGEIQAAIHAIEVAQSVGISKLCLSTDSQFLINSITCWVDGWKRNGWQLKGGGAVKNEVDFKRLDALLHHSRLQVKWNYVKAHKGIEGNEMADQLAREGAAKYKFLQN